MIKLVAWDWNGTLLADTQACVDGVGHVITAFGGNLPSKKKYQQEFNFPVHEFYLSCGADREDLLSQDYAGMFHDFYAQRAENCRTRRGAREVLKWLGERSIDSIILSNHLQEGILEQLQRLKLEDYFTQVLGNGDTKSTAAGNNKIHRMEDYLAQSSYDPAHLVVIGDSPEDVGIGKHFGAKTIGITGGYFSISRLKVSHPDYLITSLTQAIEVFKTLQS